MSTKKPRITVTLEPHVYDVLRRISADGGGSMSEFVSSLLTDNLPTLERMAGVFSRFAAIRSAAGDAELGPLRESMAQAHDELEPVLLGLLRQCDEQLDKQLDIFLHGLGGGSGEGADEGAAGAAAEASDPPI